MGHLAFSKKMSPQLLGNGSPSSERREPSSIAREWSPSIFEENVSLVGFKSFYAVKQLSRLIHTNQKRFPDEEVGLVNRSV